MSDPHGDISTEEDGDTMALTKERKQALIREFARFEGDTGSPEVQVALLTERINQLTEHLKANKHDNHSRRGLLKMVGARRSHLKYIAKKNPEAYRALLSRLGLRR